MPARAGNKSGGGDANHPAAGSRTGVDGGLDAFGSQRRAVGRGAVAGDEFFRSAAADPEEEKENYDREWRVESGHGFV
jgi:hypothetical protein